MIESIAEHISSLEHVESTEIKDGNIHTRVAFNNNNFVLKIIVNDNFPKALPDIYIQDPASHGLLPHVCWKGKVCYNDGEGISIDTEQPNAVAEYALRKTIESLSIEEDKRKDIFYNEFEGYWNMQDPSRFSYLFFSPGDSVELVNTSLYKDEKSPCAIFKGTNENINSEYNFFALCKADKTHMNGVYFPLERLIEPPLPKNEIGIDFLDKIICALSDENQKTWEHLLASGKLPKKSLHILISQPRPKGGKSLFGVSIPFGINWLKGNINSYKRKITPYQVQRHIPEYLIPRSSGHLGLSRKNIALIGCGSVGSRIAELLIMGGCGTFSYFDHDYFLSENLYKHILDSSYIGQNKVEALADQLKSRFPYISITPYHEEITDINDLLLGHDLIIDATGMPTLNRVLNQQLQENSGDTSPLLLTTWVEPLGLGGHTVLTNPKSTGCLHCLFHKDNSKQLSSIFSFVEGEQKISRNLTGCGGAFTPFSALDAAKTAEMTARMVIDALTTDNIDNNYQWWRGNDLAARKESIKTSSWYLACQHGADKQISEIFKAGCPVCEQ